METIENLIVGGGIIGVSLAYALRGQAEATYVVEAGADVGAGMSSRNSGVVHAGIYYPKHSLKTRLCRRGRDLLYDFAASHQVPVLRCGKYIVAQTEAEDEVLADLRRHNPEVPLLERAPPDHVRAKSALFSPLSGIVDTHAFIQALKRAGGADYIFHAKVEEVEALETKVRVVIDGETYYANHFFNCCGLAAPNLVAGHRHYYAKGNYFRLKPPAGLNLPRLIYPVVPVAAKSLGVHLTGNIHGEMFLGPDLEWIDCEDYGVNPNRLSLFYQAAKAYLPWLQPEHLQPAYAGIRAKLSPHDFSDFTFLRQGGRGQAIHCLGIESPGLTAAMAIGEHLAALKNQPTG